MPDSKNTGRLTKRKKRHLRTRLKKISKHLNNPLISSNQEATPKTLHQAQKQPITQPIHPQKCKPTHSKSVSDSLNLQFILDLSNDESNPSPTKNGGYTSRYEYSGSARGQKQTPSVNTSFREFSNAPIFERLFSRNYEEVGEGAEVKEESLRYKKEKKMMEGMGYVCQE